jgi:hypothetical protein
METPSFKSVMKAGRQHKKKGDESNPGGES